MIGICGLVRHAMYRRRVGFRVGIGGVRTSSGDSVVKNGFAENKSCVFLVSTSTSAGATLQIVASGIDFMQSGETAFRTVTINLPLSTFVDV